MLEDTLKNAEKNEEEKSLNTAIINYVECSPFLSHTHTWKCSAFNNFKIFLQNILTFPCIINYSAST